MFSINGKEFQVRHVARHVAAHTATAWKGEADLLGDQAAAAVCLPYPSQRQQHPFKHRRTSD
jgi:hypothetical protein